jgi:hypothetical protein
VIFSERLSGGTEPSVLIFFVFSYFTEFTCFFELEKKYYIHTAQLLLTVLPTMLLPLALPWHALLLPAASVADKVLGTDVVVIREEDCVCMVVVVVGGGGGGITISSILKHMFPDLY